MKHRFLIIATLFSFLLLAFVLSIGFKTMSNIGKNSQEQSSSTIVNYANKAVTKATEVAAPVLDKLGIDVQEDFMNPKEKVQKELENATSAVNEATKKIMQ